MQATLEIGVSIIVTGAVLWWIYKGFTGGDWLGDKLGMAGVKIFFWIIFVFLAVGLISYGRPTSIPQIPVLVMYVGVLASFGFVVAGYVANRIRDVRVGRDRRLAGIPSEPSLLRPWIPAVLTGFLSMCFIAVVIGAWSIVIRQQELLQDAQRHLIPGSEPVPYGMTTQATMVNWMVGTVLAIVLVAYGIQWFRYRKAWRHYEELRIGIKNMAAETYETPGSSTENA